MAFILNIIIIILILGVIIFVHELGHLLACKLRKVFVEEFAIGMGPKIFSRKFGETIYSLRALPIGGFNKIKGEEFEAGEEQDDDPRSLHNQTPGTKILVYLSGVFMNILLAVIIFYISLATMSFQWPIDSQYRNFEPVFGTMEVKVFDDKVKYSGIVEDTPAYHANLPEEGYIKSINGQQILYTYEATDLFAENAGKDVEVEVCGEDCNQYILNITEDGRMGVYINQNYIPFVQYQGWEIPFVGFLHVTNWGKYIGTALGDMFTEASETGDYEQVKMSLAGPVGLYVIIDYIRDLGFIALLDITANISLSIAFFNLLPIPALDGGRAIMLLIEVLSGRKLNRKFEAWAIQISFIALLLLMVLILFKDVIYYEKLKDLLN